MPSMTSCDGWQDLSLTLGDLRMPMESLTTDSTLWTTKSTALQGHVVAYRERTRSACPVTGLHQKLACSQPQRNPQPQLANTPVDGGYVYGIGTNQEVYKITGGSWTNIAGCCVSEIAVGGGNVYGIGTNLEVYKVSVNGGSWGQDCWLLCY